MELAGNGHVCRWRDRGGEKVHAEWIVGADGIYSRVRGWTGLEVGVHREVRFAQRRHYRALLPVIVWRSIGVPKSRPT